MVGHIDHFNQISGLAAERQALEDVRDLNHEIAGLDTGRNHRFLSGGNSGRGDSTEKKAKRRLQTMLDLMLLDPEYGKAYRKVSKALNDAETDTEKQIQLARDALKSATAELETLDETAAELLDGTKVYFDLQSGQVFTEDEDVLSEEDAAQIEFKGNEPTYTDYLAAKKKADAAEAHLNTWYEYQIILGGYRNEIEDEDNPPPRERLEEIQRQIDALRPEANVSKEAFDGDLKVADTSASMQVEQPKI